MPSTMGVNNNDETSNIPVERLNASLGTGLFAAIKTAQNAKESGVNKITRIQGMCVDALM